MSDWWYNVKVWILPSFSGMLSGKDYPRRGIFWLGIFQVRFRPTWSASVGRSPHAFPRALYTLEFVCVCLIWTVVCNDPCRNTNVSHTAQPLFLPHSIAYMLGKKIHTACIQPDLWLRLKIFGLWSLLPGIQCLQLPTCSFLAGEFILYCGFAVTSILDLL